MLKLFARFLIVMIVIAGIYLVYTNTTQTALQQFKNKESILVNFQNLPEIILQSKEGDTGYQYELLDNKFRSCVSRSGNILENDYCDKKCPTDSCTKTICESIKNPSTFGKGIGNNKLDDTRCKFDSSNQNNFLNNHHFFLPH